MIVSWFPGNGDPEIVFTAPTYTGSNPDLLGQIPVEHITTVGADQDGETILDSLLKPRDNLVLNYTVNAVTAADLAIAIRAISRAFSHHAGAGILKVVTDDAESFYIDCIVAPRNPVFPTGSESRSSTGAGLSNYWQKFSITLVAYRPWWYTTPTPETFNPWVGVELPLEIDPVWGIEFSSYADSKTLTNNGDLRIPITIQIDGPMVNPLFTKTLTGEYISITKELTAGQRLYIDTAYGDITCEIRDSSTDELIEDAFQYADVDTTWFWLDPGENYVTFTSGDANDGSSMIISKSDRYSAV
jgi:hypothetical protein